MERAERDRLITENLPLVGYHVSEMLRRVPSHIQREDLAAAGSLALVQAAESFDPSQGVPFNRYAAFRVKGAMLDELRSMDWASRGARQRAKQLDEVSQALTMSTGRLPTREELASAMGVAPAQVEAIQSDAQRRVVSIDGASDNEDNRAMEIVDDEMTPEESLLGDERSQYLRAAVKALPERLRYVIEQTFEHDRQVSDIAEELGVTQSRVSQLRTEALEMLRKGMTAHLEEESAGPAEAQGVAERRRAAYVQEVGAQAKQLEKERQRQAVQRKLAPASPLSTPSTPPAKPAESVHVTSAAPTAESASAASSPTTAPPATPNAPASAPVSAATPASAETKTAPSSGPKRTDARLFAASRPRLEMPSPRGEEPGSEAASGEENGSENAEKSPKTQPENPEVTESETSGWREGEGSTPPDDGKNVQVKKPASFVPGLGLRARPAADGGLKRPQGGAD